MEPITEPWDKLDWAASWAKCCRQRQCTQGLWVRKPKRQTVLFQEVHI